MSSVTEELMASLNTKLKNSTFAIQIPPAVFTLMEGEVVAFDAKQRTLSIKFPVKEAFLNPYGTMQGGMIATAIDNTIGPIALMHDQTNVTKELGLSYKNMITKSAGSFFVDAWFVSESNRDLFFEALAHDGNGTIYATAKAHHRLITFKK